MLRFNVDVRKLDVRRGYWSHKPLFLSSFLKRSRACAILRLNASSLVEFWIESNRFSISESLHRILPIKFRVLADFANSTNSKYSRSFLAIVWISGIITLT